MKRYTMRYPGDPPCSVTEMTRAEFIERHPRGPVVVSDGDTGEVLEVHHFGADEVLCDLCGSDPGDAVVEMVTLGGRVVRGYCLPCAEESWFPYCKETYSG